MKKILIILSILFFITGCRGWRSEKPPVHLNPNLDFQASVKAQEEPNYRPDNIQPWGNEESFYKNNRYEYLNTGIFNTGKDKQGNWVKKVPIEVNNKTLERGKERYNIYCTACHGYDGSGNGIVMEYGWFKPSAYWDDRIVNYSDGELFDIISNGIRSMPGYHTQIQKEDRWAIVTYIRALQVSNAMNLDDVPFDLRSKIKR